MSPRTLCRGSYLAKKKEEEGVEVENTLEICSCPLKKLSQRVWLRGWISRQPQSSSAGRLFSSRTVSQVFLEFFESAKMTELEWIVPIGDVLFCPVLYRAIFVYPRTVLFDTAVRRCPSSLSSLAQQGVISRLRGEDPVVRRPSIIRKKVSISLVASQHYSQVMFSS